MVVERIVNLDPHRAYEELKKILIRENCRIILEEPPERIVVEHGRVFPRRKREDFEKEVEFTLTPHGSGTRIVASVELTDDLLATYKERLEISIMLSAATGLSSFALLRLGDVMNQLYQKGYVSENVLTLFLIPFIVNALIFIASFAATIGFIIVLIIMNKRKHKFAEKVLKALP